MNPFTVTLATGTALWHWDEAPLPLHPRDLPLRRAAWYAKGEPTFSDVLAVVRLHLWTSRNRPTSTAPLASAHSPDFLLNALS